MPKAPNNFAVPEPFLNIRFQESIMYYKLFCFMGLATLATALPEAATSATLLDPFVARAQVSLRPDVVVSQNGGEFSAVARVDPFAGQLGRSGGASASASIQGLKASAFSQVMGGAGGEPARIFNANASAKVQSFYDLILTDETGSGKTHTDVSLSFLLDGFLSFSGISSLERSWVTPVLTLEYGLGQTGLGFPPLTKEIGQISLRDASRNPDDYPFAKTEGIFAGLEYRSSDLISQEFTTPTARVPLDTNLSFRMELRVNAGGTSNDGDQMGAQADFGNTLTFSPDAFFNLDQGITANSANLGLRNNRFASGNPSPSPVPLPASFWLLPMAIGALRSLRPRAARVAANP
jgi:hypothetical protein